MKKYVKIEGIYCEHCIDTITKALLKHKKIEEVFIKNNIAHISYQGNLTKEEIIETITQVNYFTKEEYISDDLKELENKISFKKLILITCISLFVLFFIDKTLEFNLFNMIPTIDSSVTYGMLFIIGVLTSIHCISMCGVINLLAIIDSNKKNYKRPFLYNLGRVLSYTIIGGIIGGIGSILHFHSMVKGIIILVAAISMLILSFHMLGIFNFKIPIIHKIKFKNNTKNAFLIGLINGLMPCGPLQAMQVYALSTGSVLKGALSMLLFGLGTLPLMLLIGVFYHFINGKSKIMVQKVSFILIFILSLIMLNRGLLVFGIDVTRIFHFYENYTKTTIANQYQVVKFDLTYSNYKDIIVQKDIPVRMIIHVDEKYLTGCNNEIEFKDFHITKKLEVGDNTIEFTPTKIGNYTYTCWMEMIKNTIKVIDDKEYFEGDKR